ncbi:hypothetical protein [Listeria grandensis]|nr:hypothetical protein [Listeria grandensis]MBC6314835.1 hypothetical protein [Listeria grandensis]
MTVTDIIALFAMLFTGGIFLLALLTFFLHLTQKNNPPRPTNLVDYFSS